MRTRRVLLLASITAASSAIFAAAAFGSPKPPGLRLRVGAAWLRSGDDLLHAAVVRSRNGGIRQSGERVELRVGAARHGAGDDALRAVPAGV